MSLVEYFLHNQIDADTFESLCTDLLFREGYSNIIPLGGMHDRGRDAEVKSHHSNSLTFFQYSLEKNWQSKLRRELKKVRNNLHNISTYIFITNQIVSGRKRDNLIGEVKTLYNWKLEIFDEKWLKLQLDEKHADIAEKYFGMTYSLIKQAQKMIVSTPDIISNQEGWLLYQQGKYEASIVKFKELLEIDNTNHTLWYIVAQCQYELLRYDEAYQSILKALEIKAGEPDYLNLQASILTESGIDRSEKTKLVTAKQIFGKLSKNSKNWSLFYNFGNVLFALGEFIEARLAYEKSINLDDTNPLVWKNLGTTFFHLNEHEKEIKCYDSALALNPELSEAIGSKAVTLLRIYHKAEEAIPLIIKAIELEGDNRRWLDGWYTLATAYLELKQYRNAFEAVEKGIKLHPGNRKLWFVKGEILSELSYSDASYQQEAIDFLELFLEIYPEHQQARITLSTIYDQTQQNVRAIQCLLEYLTDYDKKFLDFATSLNFPLINWIHAVAQYPEYVLFRDREIIEEYVNVFEDKNITADENFVQLAYLAFATTFSELATKILLSLEDNTEVDVDNLYELILEKFSVIFPLLSLHLNPTEELNTVNKKANFISHVSYGWSALSIVEMSRQIGWLIGRHRFLTEDQLKKYPTEVMGNKIQDFQSELLASIVVKWYEQLDINN